MTVWGCYLHKAGLPLVCRMTGQEGRLGRGDHAGVFSQVYNSWALFSDRPVQSCLEMEKSWVARDWRAVRLLEGHAQKRSTAHLLTADPIACQSALFCDRTATGSHRQGPVEKELWMGTYLAIHYCVFNVSHRLSRRSSNYLRVGYRKILCGTGPCWQTLATRMGLEVQDLSWGLV